MPAVIIADRVSKRFYLHRNRTSSLKERFLGLFHDRHRTELTEFWALRQVSLTIQAGESVGIVGRNGSGKSTLLKLIAGIHTPTEGRLVARRGSRMASLIELGVGFHPELTGLGERVSQRVSLRADAGPVWIGFTAPSSNTPASVGSSRSRSRTTHRGWCFDWLLRLPRTSTLMCCCWTRFLLWAMPIFSSGVFRRCVSLLNGDGRSCSCRIRPEAVRQMCSRVCVLDAGRLVFDGGVDEGLRPLRRDVSGQPWSVSSHRRHNVDNVPEEAIRGCAALTPRRWFATVDMGLR